MPEPRHLAFRIVSGLPLNRLPAAMRVDCSSDQRPDQLKADGLGGGRSDRFDSRNFSDYPLGKHLVDALVDFLKQDRARPLEEQPRNCRIGSRFLQKTGEWLSRQDAHFQGSNNTAPVVSIYSI